MAVKEISTTGTETQAKKPTLNATHRCDKCGAQAYVRVLMKDTGFDLLFCGHHYDRFLPGLAPVMRGKIDERDRLSENRKQGSENS